jgi:hypothetical protein
MKINKKIAYIVIGVISATLFCSALYISNSTKILFNERIIESEPDNLNPSADIVEKLPPTTVKENGNSNGNVAEVLPPQILDDTSTELSLRLGEQAIVRVSSNLIFKSVSSNINYHEASDKGSYQTYPYIVALEQGVGSITFTAVDSGLDYKIVILIGTVKNEDNSPAVILNLDKINEIRDMLIGLEEKKALDLLAKNNVTYRVTRRDAENFPQTMDYSEERLNLAIDKGIVTSVSNG